MRDQHHDMSDEENIFICKHCSKPLIRVRGMGMGCIPCNKVYTDKGEFELKDKTSDQKLPKVS